MKSLVPIVAKYWTAWKSKSGNLSRWILIPAVFYLELLFHLWVGGGFAFAQILELLGFGVCVGGLLNLAAAWLDEKGSRWFSAVAIFLCTTVMMVEYLVGGAFGNYIRPANIAAGAGGVLTDYADVVLEMIRNNLWRILLALLPLLLLLLSGKAETAYLRKKCVSFSLACCLGGGILGFLGLTMYPGGAGAFLSAYEFNTSVQEYGLVLSAFTDISGIANQQIELMMDVSDEISDWEPETETKTEVLSAKNLTAAIETTEEAVSAAAVVELEDKAEAELETEAETEVEPETEEETESQTEPAETEPKVLGPHVLDGVDWAELAEAEKNPAIAKLYRYIDSLKPAMENEYTGLFEGKNLILITAEAFNYALIDPELTPTLYRLATQGIEFTNYYQPSWSGNTIGGEMANFSGLAMNCELRTYSSQKPFNTIGRQLMNQGYFSRAYHNNSYSYYDRHLTHTNLGYEAFIGMGNGMEKGVQDVWPQSDAEMFEFTLPQYIDQQPFSVYYMTVSGHCRYTKAGNAQARKNWELVQDLPYSDGVRAYIACNLELEKGLAFVVEQLEAAGIADDTVIVLAPDHYPYGLGTSWGFRRNGLYELYGVDKYDSFQQDKNTLIIWSGCLEGKNIKVDAPTCGVDILPTLSNLFGVEYDSRLTVGRDALGTEEAVAFWPNGSWVTEYGKYDASKRSFTPFTTDALPEGYVDRISLMVKNKNNFSRSVQQVPFFATLQSAIGR